MHLANKAACNIQLSQHHEYNINIELAENQLENKKQKQNRTAPNTASQQLGSQQLRQEHLQLQQLSHQQADTAISRQLSKKPLPATSSQTAAWPAATLTCSLQPFKERAFSTTPSQQELLQQPACAPGACSQQASERRCFKHLGG